MREAVIVEALRTPIARGKMGKGDLSGFHPAQLLAKVQSAVVERAGIDPSARPQAIPPEGWMALAALPVEEADG